MEQLALQTQDPAITATLNIFAGAGSFNYWMFEQIAPFCNGDILETGSGIGNLSRYFIGRFEQVTLSDVEPAYCNLLKHTFSSCPSFRGVYPIDLASPDIEEQFPGLMGRFDTLIALNVIEHIENHELAIANCRKLLKPGGQLLVLVPAYPGLYNTLDRAVGHFRRYTLKMLTEVLRGEGFDIVQTIRFNAAGLPGWWFSGSVLKMKIIKSGYLAIYNKLVPILRLIDWATGRKIGLSVIAVGRKRGKADGKK